MKPFETFEISMVFTFMSSGDPAFVNSQKEQTKKGRTHQ